MWEPEWDRRAFVKRKLFPCSHWNYCYYNDRYLQLENATLVQWLSILICKYLGLRLFQCCSSSLAPILAKLACSSVICHCHFLRDTFQKGNKSSSFERSVQMHYHWSKALLHWFPNQFDRCNRSGACLVFI